MPNLSIQEINVSEECEDSFNTIPGVARVINNAPLTKRLKVLVIYCIFSSLKPFAYILLLSEYFPHNLNYTDLHDIHYSYNNYSRLDLWS